MEIEKSMGKRIKKLVKSGHDGLTVFVTPEAKELGWSSKTHVIVETKNGKIVIRKATIR